MPTPFFDTVFVFVRNDVEKRDFDNFSVCEVKNTHHPNNPYAGIQLFEFSMYCLFDLA